MTGYLRFPKTRNLFNRDSDGKIILGSYQMPEVQMIDTYFFTEKIDGTNCQLDLFRDSVKWGGRTSNAQFTPQMTAFLDSYEFTADGIREALEWEKDKPERMTIYGELYGGKIQKGGNYRGSDPHNYNFRVFDIFIDGVWLEWNNVAAICSKLNLETAYPLGAGTLEQIVKYVASKPPSIVAQLEGGNPEYVMEGVVTRPYPYEICTRLGKRIRFKLKTKDF